MTTPELKYFNRLIYASELQWNAETIVSCLEEVHKLLNTEVPNRSFSDENFIEANSGIHRQFQMAFISAANIKKLLYPRGRGKGETKASAERRQERASDLQQLLGGIELVVIPASRLRNSLEHYDEFLDDSVDKMVRGTIPHPFFYTNVILDEPPRDSAGDEVYFPFRAYYVSTAIYKNGDHEVNISALEKEAREILAQLDKISAFGKTLHQWRITAMLSALIELPLTKKK